MQLKRCITGRSNRLHLGKQREVEKRMKTHPYTVGLRKWAEHVIMYYAGGTKSWN